MKFWDTSAIVPLCVQEPNSATVRHILVEDLSFVVFCFVPVVFDKGSPRRVNISLDYGLLQAIDADAKRRGMTRSAFLSNAARNEIEERNRDR